MSGFYVAACIPDAPWAAGAIGVESPQGGPPSKGGAASGAREMEKAADAAGPMPPEDLQRKARSPADAGDPPGKSS